MHRGRVGRQLDLQFLFGGPALADPEAVHLDPDARRDQDVDVRLVGDGEHGGDRRGQFGGSQVEPALALVDHHVEALGDAPAPAAADGVLVRHRPPSRRGGRDRRRAAGRRGRQVTGEPVKVGAGLGGERGAHSLIELVVIQSAFRESLLQPLRDGVAVLVGRAYRRSASRFGFAARRHRGLFRDQITGLLRTVH